MLRRQRHHHWRRGEAIVLRSGGDEVEERLPHSLSRVLIETLEHHGELERVVGPELHLFAPVGIEKAVAIEGDEATDELAESVI